VENVLTEHPGVAAAGVVGVPDRRLGETLAAFVVPVDPASPPSAEELHAHVRARLAGFKVPACWHTLAELPLTAAGKLSRRELQRRHADGSG
jgi:acyl-coenzyme A synthetase/AMP-(fatty) acid ligase